MKQQLRPYQQKAVEEIREEEYIKIIEARVKHAESKIEPTLFDEAI